MKFDHLVKFNGTYYPAGTEVPVGVHAVKVGLTDDVPESALEDNANGTVNTYDEEGNMIITGFDITYDPLRYIVGTVSDHILTLGGEEISLRDMCGRNARVVFEIATGFEILTKGMK